MSNHFHIPRNKLITDYAYRVPRLNFSQQCGLHLTAECKPPHSDILHAMGHNHEELASLVLTWTRPREDLPTNFRLYLAPDFTVGGTFLEILTTDEYEARVEDILANEPTDERCNSALERLGTQAVSLHGSHPFHSVKADMASRLTMLYEQDILTLNDVGLYGQGQTPE